MRAKLPPEDLLTLNSLSRKIDITYNRALNLLHSGVLVSDFTASGLHLFRRKRLPEIQLTVAKEMNPYADADL